MKLWIFHLVAVSYTFRDRYKINCVRFAAWNYKPISSCDWSLGRICSECTAMTHTNCRNIWCGTQSRPHSSRSYSPWNTPCCTASWDRLRAWSYPKTRVRWYRVGCRARLRLHPQAWSLYICPWMSWDYNHRTELSDMYVYTLIS